MNELLEALTELCKAGTYYLRLYPPPCQPRIDGLASPISPASMETPRKARKSRAPKEAPAEEVTQQAAPAPAPKPAISEEQSLVKVVETANAFVRRFNVTAEGKEGLVEIRAFMASKYKAEKLKDLTHPQRVELIGFLTERMNGEAKMEDVLA